MPIDHVFVLMLENRSFDHMLGFSEIAGLDAETRLPIKAKGLTGEEANEYNGKLYKVGKSAPRNMDVDPGHEFTDVLTQLCGKGSIYDPRSPYPTITNSGFVFNYAELPSFRKMTQWFPIRPDGAMQCFTPDRLPVINTLAREFALCDAWYSSMPGPTWPNRFFALAGSSGGLDHSPNKWKTGKYSLYRGYKFKNGSIFNRNIRWRIYSGFKIFANVLALKGIHINHVRRYATFSEDVSSNEYDAQFTWIEPSYGNVAKDFKGGSSQHPLGGFERGERIIKKTYEAIRQSPLWDRSLLIITWDEHGGFYDHVAPPSAIPPDDMPYPDGLNKHGFDFSQYGVRVPTVVVSPNIPRNTIDRQLYDHSSIPATVGRLFGFRHFTKRDQEANDVLSLESVREDDAPWELPQAINAQETEETDLSLDTLDIELSAASRPNEEIGLESGDSLPSFLYLVTRAHIQLSPFQILKIIARSARVRTRQDARDYFEEVRQLISSRNRNEIPM